MATKLTLLYNGNQIEDRAVPVTMTLSCANKYMDGDIVASLGQGYANANWSTTASSGGTASGSGTYKALFPGDQTFSVNCSAKEHYHFVNWTTTGGEAGTKVENNILTIGAGSSGNVLATANFAPDTYTITYNVNDSRFGSISGTTTYTYNESSSQSIGFNISLTSGVEISSITTTKGSIGSTSSLILPAGTYGNIVVTANLTPFGIVLDQFRLTHLKVEYELS